MGGREGKRVATLGPSLLSTYIPFLLLFVKNFLNTISAKKFISQLKLQLSLNPLPQEEIKSQIHNNSI